MSTQIFAGVAAPTGINFWRLGTRSLACLRSRDLFALRQKTAPPNMSVQHGRLSMSGKGLVGRNVEPIPFRFAPADEILLEVAWMACCVLAAGSQRAMTCKRLRTL